MAKLFEQCISFVFTIDFYLNNLRLLRNAKMNISF